MNTGNYYLDNIISELEKWCEENSLNKNKLVIATHPSVYSQVGVGWMIQYRFNDDIIVSEHYFFERMMSLNEMVIKFKEMTFEKFKNNVLEQKKELNLHPYIPKSPKQREENIYFVKYSEINIAHIKESDLKKSDIEFIFKIENNHDEDHEDAKKRIKLKEKNK